MTKVEKGGVVQLTCGRWTRQKDSRLVFVKPNIPAPKYGKNMEIETANIFIEFIKRKHKDIKLSDCEIFVDEKLPYVASPDRILLCSCCQNHVILI